MSFLKALTIAMLAASLAACGGGKHNDQASTGSQTQSSQDQAGITTGSPAPPVNNATPIGGTAAGNGGTMVAPVPAGLNCGSAQPVWVNKRSHAYHEPSDPLYGRTKHGAYMCPDAAISAGYHLAAKGTGHHHHSSGATPSGEPSPLST